MGLTLQYVLFLLVLRTCLSVDSDVTAPVVQTNHGKVRGVTKQYPAGSVSQYLGIPFAAPPIGQLRFKKPLAHNGWSDTLNATEYGPSCMQYFFANDAWLIPNKNISEDCLQLNVFIPFSINKTHPKTVMLWIHGGGFTAGQASLFDASYLALEGDVIVVTINYRLGIFGFLSTEDGSARGNYGLWDQHFAFKWVNENIAEFGGNPASVCIFGESAGGYSVGIHTISPLNKNYFQRAISESGAVSSPRVLSEGSRGMAMNTGRLLKCPVASSQDLIACLRSRSAQDILKIQSKASEVSNEMSFITSLGPVIDGDFIPQSPVSVLNNRNSSAYQMFKSVSVMAGTNNAEGGLLYFYLKSYQERFKFNISEGIPKEVLCNLLIPALVRDYYNGNSAVSEAICQEYTVNGTSAEQGRSILDVYAHTQFVIPTVTTNTHHASPSSSHQNNTYHYVFSHQPSFSWIQERPSWLIGANHAGELPFVFGLDAMYKKTSPQPENEKTLSKQMMIYWSNFAKTGNPNTPNTDVPYWPAFDTDERRYMDLRVPLKSGIRAFDEKVTFWTQTVPSIAEATSSTIRPTTTPKSSNSSYLSRHLVFLPVLIVVIRMACEQ